MVKPSTAGNEFRQDNMNLKLKKCYHCHEAAYKKMKEKGIRSWGKFQSAKNKDINSESKRFLNDIFPQPWFPKNGKALELGCGTAPILRWVCKRGFSGLGVDVSKTAIYLAKQQTKERNIHFKKTDVCSAEIKKIGKFDVIIDGNCLHCIVSVTERRQFLKNASKLLNKDGVLVVMTMCGPIKKKEFLKTRSNQKILNYTIYAQIAKNNDYVPTRKILPRKDIIAEIKEAGFDILLLRYIKPSGKEPCGTLMIAVTKK
jgi:2-polyprenyl-3-methyl-5-hydroxy-6-metoxy-1,4-benzoquinol methylase